RTDEIDAAREREKRRSKPLPSERRQLTILHLHLAWSGARQRDGDAEQIRDALAAYRAGVEDIVEANQGHIQYAAAQEIVIIFGYPTAREDDAQHAARAGLAIRESSRLFNSDARLQGLPNVDVGMGLDTGVAVIERSVEKDGEYSIIGSLTERAEWLATIAGKGQFLVSDESRTLLEDHFLFDSVGEHARVSGGPVSTVHRLTGASVHHGRMNHRADLTALVGRQTELALLEERWHQALDGRGQAAVIVGESGLGKSRLARELSYRAARQAPEGVVEFACFSDHQNSVLYPVIAHLRQQLSLQVGQEDPSGTVAALERLLANAGLSLADTMPLILDLLDVSDDERYPPLDLAAPLQKSRTLEALLALLLGGEREEPRLLLIDDFQWADATFRELMELVVDYVRSVPALVVFTTRPENIPGWVTRSHVTQISVAPLTSAETEALITAIGENAQLPVTVIEQLVNTSQGNPLFAEELTRSALYVDRARQGEGRRAADVDTDIPLTLQESLLARLDRLKSDAKTVVRLAATIGRQFDYDLSRAFADELGVEDFDELLQELISEDIIYQRGLPPRVSYAFRHVLIQEAAYQSILLRERESYHQRIADLLREKFSEISSSRPELLARHLTRAGRPEDAVPLWAAAGRLAARKAAHIEACALFETALKLLRQQPESEQRDAAELDVQVALGPALMAVKGYSARPVREAYGRAEQLLNRADATLAIAPVLFGLWTHHVTAGNLTRAMGLGQRLFSIAEDSANEDLLLESHVLLGVTQSYIGPMAESLEHLGAAVALYDPDLHGNHAFVYGQDPKMASLSYAAIPHWWLGRTVTAGNCVEEAIAHARRINHPRSLAFALANGARTELKRGDYQRCIEIAGEAADICEKHGYPDFLAMGNFHRLASEYWVDRDGQTVEALRSALEALIAIGNSVSIPYYCSVLADILSLEGEYEDALEKLAVAEKALERHGQDLDAVEVRRVRGMVDWRRQSGGVADVPDPERTLRQAHELAVRQGAASWRLLAAMALEEFLCDAGRTEGAGSFVAAALEAMPEQGYLPAFNDAKRLLDRLT
ncbi:MAG: AAA family ATPase, partial [Halieaceae bacterium]|nr:AAA family ATPase [Halieaceae bacterium]